MAILFLRGIACMFVLAAIFDQSHFMHEGSHLYLYAGISAGLFVVCEIVVSLKEMRRLGLRYR